jgi:hypothetical protein
MIDRHAYPAEPWAVRETSPDLRAARQPRRGRAAGAERDLPDGIYESYPSSYGERGFGLPEDGQTVVNVTDGKLIRLLVEDEPLDVHRGRLHRHERVLDLRAGNAGAHAALELARRALGERIEVVAGTPVTRPVPPALSLTAPTQPTGRAPARRAGMTQPGVIHASSTRSDQPDAIVVGGDRRRRPA